MPVDFQDSCYWVLLVWGCFSVSKTIIPDAQEHFLTHSTRRHTYLVGGLGVRDAVIGVVEGTAQVVTGYHAGGSGGRHLSRVRVQPIDRQCGWSGTRRCGRGGPLQSGQRSPPRQAHCLGRQVPSLRRPIHGSVGGLSLEPSDPKIYQRLLATVNPKKLAITACMRKLLTMLNSMMRTGERWDTTIGNCSGLRGSEQLTAGGEGVEALYAPGAED